MNSKLLNSQYKIDEQERKIINALKGFLCCYVLFIHVFAYTEKGYVNMVGGHISLDTPDWLYNIEYVVSRVISHCAVPVFFVIASMLLYRKEFIYIENLKKKIRTLVIPYVLITSFWIIFYLVVQAIPQFSVYFSDSDKLINGWGLFQFIDAYLGVTGSPLVYPLWFVENLFILNVLSIPIKFIIDKGPKITAIVLLVIYILPFSSISFFRKSGLIYFCIGYYLVKYNIHITDVKRIPMSILSGLYAVIIVVCSIHSDSLAIRYYDLVNIIIGALWIARLCCYIKVHENSIIRLIGENSFFIYIMHEMWLRIIVKGTAKVLGISLVVQVMEYFIIPLGLIFCFTVISIQMRKYLPRCYGVITGNRVY